MKKNWINGLDRVAIVLAVPIAIWGASYSSKKFSERNGVLVYTCENDMKKAESIYKTLPEENKDFSMLSMTVDVPKKGGVIANGEKELIEARNESLVMNIAMERAIKDGGDPKGTLVNKKTFGVDVGAEHVELCLIPCQWNRWSVGIIGAICFAITTTLSVGLLTRGIPRVFRWVRDGFF